MIWPWVRPAPSGHGASKAMFLTRREEVMTMAIYGKAAVLDRPNGTFTVEEYQVPEPGPSELLVRVDLAGICATDAHIYEGRFAGLRYPVALGHEITGIVERLGAGVTEDAQGRTVAEGDRVVVVPAVTCGRCFACAIGRTPNRCENRFVYGFQSAEAVAFSGGLGQYLYVMNRDG
jgi:L-iditol 2-dehydrogenase